MSEGVTQKRWFTDGATMAYEGRWRSIFWAVNLFLYILVNMFFLRIRTGVWLQLSGPQHTSLLIPEAVAPLNLFYFPTQIITIGLLTAMLCTIPILTGLLYNLLHAVPFVLAVFFVGHNPILSMCLFLGCVFVSAEPFRFKSKVVATILALVPVILYWVIFAGANPETDALRWAVLYAPWGLAFLLSVAIFGVVIVLGHVLRYRPGIVMPIFAVLLAGTIVLFHTTVGMDERDYQAQVFRHRPDQIKAFQPRSIVGLLEKETAERLEREPYLTEERIREQLRFEWRWAFRVSSDVGQMLENVRQGEGDPMSAANQEMARFFQRRNDAVEHINGFIAEHPEDRWVADALYVKGLLYDLKVDARALRDENLLRFYHEVPSASSEAIWQELVEEFGDTVVSAEARRRLARLWGARKPAQAGEPYGFERALGLLKEAEAICRAERERRREKQERPGWMSRMLGGVFSAPPATISNEALAEMEMKIGRLMSLMSKENRTGHVEHEERLADFVGLDPRQLNYEEHLKVLLLDSPQPDPLRDNIELAQVLLIGDAEVRLEALEELAERYGERDGAIRARLEAALLLRRGGLDEEGRSRLRGHLEAIVSLRPDTTAGRLAARLLNGL